MTSKEKDQWRKAHKKEWDEFKKTKIISQDYICPFCGKSLVRTKKMIPIKGVTLHHLFMDGDYTDLSKTIVIHRRCHSVIHELYLTNKETILFWIKRFSLLKELYNKGE